MIGLDIAPSQTDRMYGMEKVEGDEAMETNECCDIQDEEGVGSVNILCCLYVSASESF
jgi:hypothetical protein